MLTSPGPCVTLILACPVPYVIIAWQARADLVLAVGTSLAGMNADRIVHSCAERAAGGGKLGVVIVGLQRTTFDPQCTLRIFAPCDTCFAELASHLELGALVPPERPKGVFFRPAILCHNRKSGAGGGGEDAAAADESERGESGPLNDCYLLEHLPYNAMGRKAEGTAPTTDLDLRDGAQVVIPSGPYAGAAGEVDGADREGNPRCRFHLLLKPGGTFKAPMTLVVGSWWLQAAADGAVGQLPVVNVPTPQDTTCAATELRALCAAYGAPLTP